MTRHTIEDLLTLMARLRDPQSGCPWDLKQDYRSIAPSTLEETYEVIEAIETADHAQLRDELGDLLFQVVFYAQLAREEGRFDFTDIVDGIVRKLLSRHPHVFPAGTLESRPGEQPSHSDTELSQNWEMRKQQEREGKGHASLLDDIPLALPAMQRAVKIQKRMAHVGFDWETSLAVLDKIAEELAELREAVAGGDRAAMADELGDNLFALANLARHLKLDPESALRDCNRKVEARFRYIEAELAAAGSRPQDAELDRMEALWQEAKRLCIGKSPKD